MNRIYSLLKFNLAVALCALSCNSSTSNSPKVDTATSHDMANKVIPIDSLVKVPLDSTIKKPQQFARQISKKVKSGDNFNDIMRSNGVNRMIINRLNQQINEKFDQRQFKVGQSYQLNFSLDSKVPSEITYDIDGISALVININKIEVSIREKEITIRTVELTRTISNSLEATLASVAFPGLLSNKIVTVFAWKFDFRKLKKGDQFKIIYQEQLVDDIPIGIGELKAIHFKHDGVKYQGYWFDNGYGGEYFNENGMNLSHAPLRCDLVTSLYSKRRLHPVRRTYRAHLGMDFKAEIGTPVFALKEGVVLQSGYRKANGNCVRIKHEGKGELSTMYLHLNKIASGIIAGDTVRQSQLIGYVGTTGLSSAPHLCLRVFQNGKQKDPLSFDFPVRPNIPTSKMALFKEMILPLKERLSTTLR